MLNHNINTISLHRLLVLVGLWISSTTAFQLISDHYFSVELQIDHNEIKLQQEILNLADETKELMQANLKLQKKLESLKNQLSNVNDDNLDSTFSRTQVNRQKIISDLGNYMNENFELAKKNGSLQERTKFLRNSGIEWAFSEKSKKEIAFRSKVKTTILIVGFLIGISCILIGMKIWHKKETPI